MKLKLIRKIKIAADKQREIRRNQPPCSSAAARAQFLKVERESKF